MPPDNTNTTTNTNIHTLLTTALTTPRSILPDQPSPQQLSLLQSLESTLTVTATATATLPSAEATTATSTFLAPYPYHFPRPQWINLISFLAFATKKRLLSLEDTAVEMLHAALERHAGVGVGVVATETDTDTDTGTGTGTGADRGKGKGTGVKVKVKDQGKEEEEKGEGLRVLVSCAAVWVLVMGEELWERRSEEEKDIPETENQKEKETISKDTWRAWTDRFQFVSLRDDLDLSTRDLAAEAAAVMLRVR